ncbi:elongation factor G-binding protein [Bacillus lacus]|uniref:Elongation factor G-binding protein n=1 Tax=Metabacillus lacus TaxID=1983721 RepID=A0A7X2J2H0_9BACI|nr:FusB/FusC family EF-G-binding protein [Metabacillus lacus]MRX74069.1 elongation factor G-binding protein [Metabacillus lacus]
MTQAFIKNEQFNYMKKQLNMLKDTSKRTTDSSVLQAVKEMTMDKILSLFPHADSEQSSMLQLDDTYSDLHIEKYLERLTHYVIRFPEVSEKDIQKLFPKVKKLKFPDYNEYHLQRTTYLSWSDISTNKRYLLFEREGELIGVECKFTMVNRDNMCSFCNSHSQVTFLSAITKAKNPSNPDYYKAIGHYVCFDPHLCNSRISGTQYLDSFIDEYLKVQ